jgi:hypothetical protein
MKSAVLFITLRSIKNPLNVIGFTGRFLLEVVRGESKEAPEQVNYHLRWISFHAHKIESGFLKTL